MAGAGGAASEAKQSCGWCAPPGAVENDCFGALAVQWHEDHGHGVRRGKGLEVMRLILVLAYNLLALLIARHLRSADLRRAAWWQVRDWVRDALLGPARDCEGPEPGEYVLTED